MWSGFEVPDRHGLVPEPETMWRPSELTATELTTTLMPREPVERAPVSRSQTATVRS